LSVRFNFREMSDLAPAPGWRGACLYPPANHPSDVGRRVTVPRRPLFCSWLQSAPVKPCVFCEVVRGEREAAVVYEDAETVAFLDHKPLLHGHCLLVPRRHVETLGELPAELAARLFANVQRLAGAVERGLEAAGAFVAINVKISQSVPHLHVHVVPRWKGDGLFSHKLLWKRAPYASETQKQEVREKIRRALGG
jgi:histidine triad (HIT) family protein